MLKDLLWYLREGWIKAFTLWSQDLIVETYLFRDVRKMTNQPISGDSLAKWKGGA